MGHLQVTKMYNEENYTVYDHYLTIILQHLQDTRNNFMCHSQVFTTFEESITDIVVRGCLRYTKELHCFPFHCVTSSTSRNKHNSFLETNIGCFIETNFQNTHICLILP